MARSALPAGPHRDPPAAAGRSAAASCSPGSSPRTNPRVRGSRYYRQWSFALQPPESRIWELSDEFGDAAAGTLDATTFGKWTPELAERVGAGGRLVLAGVSTDCCVLSTALAAADAGVHVAVVSDACAGVDDQAHQRALEVMELYAPLIEVLDADRLLTGGAG